MGKKPDYQGVTKVLWCGPSQAVRLPAECRFETTEVEIIKKDDQLTLRPNGKNWTEYFGAKSHGTLPKQQDLASGT